MIQRKMTLKILKFEKLHFCDLKTFSPWLLFHIIESFIKLQ